MEKTQTPVMLYTEQTPNPESLKFVSNKMLYNGTADFIDKELAEEWSPLATELFEFPFVKRVYISANFVTITKELNYSWDDIMLTTKEYIKDYIFDNKMIIRDGYAEALKEIQKDQLSGDYSENDKEIVVRIKELIDTYVKPAVEMDGGNIEFDSYNEGIVTVILQGSCSGCPSATVTLKSGIEGMLKRMIPEVKEVVSSME